MPGMIGWRPRRRDVLAAALTTPFARASQAFRGEVAAGRVGALAAQKGILFGAACLIRDVSVDPIYAALLARECRVLVAQNELKWAALRPAPELFDFNGADGVLAFAERIGARMRGHTLVWHEALPKWCAREINARTGFPLLAEHIAAVCGRYRGRLHSWDVVNEAVEPEDGRADGLRETPWLRALGPSYIAEAFRMAAAADPSALLVYNDYGVCDAGRKASAKRVAVLRLLDRLAAEGAPVHALGMQAHLTTGMRITERDLRGFLDEVAERGMQVMITELDVLDEKAAPEAPYAQDARVSDVYRAFLEVVLAHPATTACITWGLSDRYSWLRAAEGRKDSWALRPLPFDDNHLPKAAWLAIAVAMGESKVRN